MDSKFDVLISSCKKICNALLQLDETSAKILYVVDDDKKLLGSVSDGDIRRGLLKGLTLNDSVEDIMFKAVSTISKKDINDKNKLDGLFRKGYFSVPVVKAGNIIEDIIFSNYLFNETSKIYPTKTSPIFILAGGLGKRLEPFTKVLPKPLIPISGTPILERIMDKFSNYGFSKFIVSVNYKAEMIKLYLNNSDVKDKFENISFVMESKPLGTIGSLGLAKNQINEDFFISNSDIIIEDNLHDIYEYHLKSNNILTIIGCEKQTSIPYGVLKSNKNGLLECLEEKPSFNFVVNTGLYVAKPEVFSYLRKNEKKDMNILIQDIIDDSGKIGVYQISEDSWFDIGQWAEYQATITHFECLRNS